MRRRRFGRGFGSGVGALLAIAVLAPAALSASPGEIYADLADGKLDGSYTQAELKAYARDAAVQGYGSPAVPVPSGGGSNPVVPAPSGGGSNPVVPAPSGGGSNPVAPVPSGGGTNPAVPAPSGGGSAGGSVGQPGQSGSGVAGEQTPPSQTSQVQTPRVQTPPALTGTTGSTGTLPFTGSELVLFALVGGGLLLGGLLLRVSARNGRRTTSS